MAALATPISEQWIRERVGLDHKNLEDVKSLALPGTYHEKITLLGNSLYKFSRLKNLDLSRNNIGCIQGLENCTLLENLNLYYNDITSLTELAPLAKNTKLTHLDLRLNPVSRSEADYRLYLVSILPNLKILDDRPVRETERESALSHFNNYQNSSPSVQLHSDAGGDNKEHERVTSSTSRIVPSGHPQTTMDPDDCAVLNLLAKTDADKPTNKASAKIEPDCEDYQPSELARLGEEALEGKTENKAINDYDEYYLQKYPNIPLHRMAEMNVNSSNGAQREAEAYSIYKGQGHFTANPDYEQASETSQRPSSRSPSTSGPKDSNQTESKYCPSFIALLDLVDKYWNGSKSLHDNKKFMGLASSLLSKLSEESTSVLQQRVGFLRAENQQLKLTGKTAEDWNRAKLKLDESEKQMESLKKSLETLKEENSRLKLSAYKTSTNGSTPSRHVVSSSYETDELRNENSQLKFKLKQMEQMSELANMLQQSHKSLIQTNDHLLREITDMKSRDPKSFASYTTH